jgi:hypothetical protein
VPGQVFGQDGLEFADRVVRRGCHRGQKKPFSLPYSNQLVKFLSCT